MKQKYLDGITITKENRDKVKHKLIKKCLEDPNLKIQYYEYDEVNNPSKWKDLTTDLQAVIGGHYRLAYLTNEEKANKFEKPELTTKMQEHIRIIKNSAVFAQIEKQFPNWLIELNFRLYYAGDDEEE